MQDASGVQTFAYGNMGELIENIHTFVVPGGVDYTFKMQWNYDSWNRINTIRYPDGEEVEYTYNTAGMLHSLKGNKHGQEFNYIDSIRYDEFGSRVRIRYGNNTSTRYSYDPNSRRLVNLISYDASNTIMQDIDYTYNDNGNISQASNHANPVGNMGGHERYNYDYDSLSRLTGSTGNFNGINTQCVYELSMSYSASGNIVQKNLSATTLLSGTVQSYQYSNNYNYSAHTQPHTVQNIQSTHNDHQFNWDANGNMVSLIKPREGFYREMCWDEENRLAVVRDPQFYNHYLYNAGGERVWKLAGKISKMSINGNNYVDMALLDRTLYVNPYMVVSEREYTKHYYIEGQRVTSKIGGGISDPEIHPRNGTLEPIGPSMEELSVMLMENIRNRDCANRLRLEIRPEMGSIEEQIFQDRLEENLYYYHGDHLGSSSWITDASGNVNQHLAYMPFGEDFVNERIGRDVRFKFTGKERDSETGMDYFGARYYEKDLSIWLSVDPMIDKHPDYSGYAYCYNNPTNLIDPFGLDTILVDRKGNFAEKTLSDNVNDFDVIVKVSKKEREANKINYNKKGKLRKRHKQQQLEKDAVNYRKVSGDRYTRIDIGGSNRAEQGKLLFTFLEDNTNVEWSYTAYLPFNTTDVNIMIATSHDMTSESYGPTFAVDMAKNKTGKIISCLHTHPSGNLLSSEADRSFRDKVRANGQDPIFSIMSWGKSRDYNDDN